MLWYKTCKTLINNNIMTEKKCTKITMTNRFIKWLSYNNIF